MSDRRKALHDLIEEASEEDLPLLSELVARFQRPFDFLFQPVSTASPQTGTEQRRQELLLEAHMCARTTHLRRQHTASTAKRLGIDPARIEFATGGGSIGAGDSVRMTRHWSEGAAFCRLNTFDVESQEIITFDKAKISDSGREVVYKLRVLTAKNESETDLNVPF
ncbi:MAG: hypothetical protein JO319_05745 [Acidobacteriaceae bacterium]|nr:hypothetical protein [Acidobacteriaceae bacterium]